jgi:hypothetical protein
MEGWNIWAVLLSLVRDYGLDGGKYWLHVYMKIRPTYFLQIHCSVTRRHLLGLVRKTELFNSKNLFYAQDMTGLFYYIVVKYVKK